MEDISLKAVITRPGVDNEAPIRTQLSFGTADADAAAKTASKIPRHFFTLYLFST
jgi:hypothetical protein